MLDKTLIESYFSEMKPISTDLAPNGRLRPPVSCLLCDIYGTLFISASGDIGTVQQDTPTSAKLSALLARYGLDMTPQDLTRHLHAAIRSKHDSAKERGVDFPEIKIEEVWSEILFLKDPQRARSWAVEYEMVMNPVWPMPGLKALINTCRSSGIRLGIISNAQFFTPLLFEWYLGKDLRTLGFDPELTIFSYEHGWAKPSRFLFDLAVERLQKKGISTRQVAYIGNDLRNDIVPAKAVGFQTVLFAGDARSLRMREEDSDCTHPSPDCRVTHLSQLVSCFRQK